MTREREERPGHGGTMGGEDPDPLDALAAVARGLQGALLGGLIARSGRADLAEDALAQAFAEAAASWPRTGTPGNPRGWLMTVAWRRLLDATRAERALREHAHRIARPETLPATGADESLTPVTARLDERVPLLFMAAHPALSVVSRAALSLRFVLGVPTARIARLFHAPPQAMAARITRAKRRVLTSDEPFTVPVPRAWPERAQDVARAVLLAFTEGYAPGGDRAVLPDACADAVRLALLAHGALPGDASLRALAALLLLQHSRRDARCDAEGRIIPLADQDRGRWHHADIEAGLRLVRTLPDPGTGYPEELRLQALIAAEHARAASAAETDWRRIAAHYARLEALTASPVVRLNRAIALAEAEGPRAGLALLPGVEAQLPGHHRTALAAAEMLRRKWPGRPEHARAAYLDALAACPPGAERAHIERRLASLSPG